MLGEVTPQNGSCQNNDEKRVVKLGVSDIRVQDVAPVEHCDESKPDTSPTGLVEKTGTPPDLLSQFNS